MPEPLRTRIAKELDGHWTTDQRDANGFAQCACGKWHWEEDAARHRADAVMAIVQPELDRLTAERDGHQSGREQLRAISREHRAERDRYRLAWQSARRRAQADAEQLAFIHAVLRLALTGDFRSELLWHSDGQRITVSVDVSDVFAWGGSDAEDLTPERLPLLAQAMADLKAVHPHDDMYTVDLYAARIRQMRPQGAAYPKERAATQALFDACGPERATGLGNPRPVPTPTEDGQP